MKVGHAMKTNWQKHRHFKHCRIRAQGRNRAYPLGHKWHNTMSGIRLLFSHAHLVPNDNSMDQKDLCSPV